MKSILVNSVVGGNQTPPWDHEKSISQTHTGGLWSCGKVYLGGRLPLCPISVILPWKESNHILSEA